MSPLVSILHSTTLCVTTIFFLKSLKTRKAEMLCHILHSTLCPYRAYLHFYTKFLTCVMALLDRTFPHRGLLRSLKTSEFRVLNAPNLFSYHCLVV